jgi:hypothetical protein
VAEIQVNGRVYQLVTIDELTLAEAMVVWDYTKMGLDEIADIEGFYPGVIAALIHVSVARGEPDENDRQIRTVVGAIPVAQLNEVFMDVSVEVPDEVPLPGKHSNGSGDGSRTSSVPAPAPSTQPGTGSPGSATGATFDRRISAG